MSTFGNFERHLLVERVPLCRQLLLVDTPHIPWATLKAPHGLPSLPLPLLFSWHPNITPWPTQYQFKKLDTFWMNLNSPRSRPFSWLKQLQHSFKTIYFSLAKKWFSKCKVIIDYKLLPFKRAIQASSDRSCFNLAYHMQSERVLLAGLLTKALARRGEQYVQHDLSKARLFLHILTWLFQAFKWSMWWTNFPMRQLHFVRWHLQCTWDQSVNDTLPQNTQMSF